MTFKDFLINRIKKRSNKIYKTEAPLKKIKIKTKKRNKEILRLLKIKTEMKNYSIKFQNVREKDLTNHRKIVTNKMTKNINWTEKFKEKMSKRFIKEGILTDLRDNDFEEVVNRYLKDE